MNEMIVYLVNSVLFYCCRAQRREEWHYCSCQLRQNTYNYYDLCMSVFVYYCMSVCPVITLCPLSLLLLFLLVSLSVLCLQHAFIAVFMTWLSTCQTGTIAVNGNCSNNCIRRHNVMKAITSLLYSVKHITPMCSGAQCGLRGCKNGPAPFPGRMLYKATKPGLVSVLYLSMFFIVLVFIRAPFYVLLVFIVCFLCFGCSS